MKVPKLLKTCKLCGGQLIPTTKDGNRMNYRCKGCGALVDAKIKMKTEKR